MTRSFPVARAVAATLGVLFAGSAAAASPPVADAGQAAGDGAPQGGSMPARRGNDDPIVAESRDSDALFRQVFGSERPALLAGAYAVVIDDINVGDYRMDPGRGDDGMVDAEMVRNALLPIALQDLGDRLRQMIEGAAAGRTQGQISFADLRAAGLDVAFDPGLLVLRIRIPAALRNVRELALRTARRRQNIDTVRQADVSAYVSARAGVDLIERSSGGERGFSGLAADIDVGANLFGVAVEARFRYNERRRTPWSRGDVRLTYDDTSRLIRYEAGDLSVSHRPFQMTPRMAGLAAFREYPIDPYRNIRPTVERGFTLDRAARVEILLNGATVRSFDLPAGRFSLRDFPLIPSAANDIELRITYATGEVQLLSFPAFYDIELLQPGLVDFAINIGMPYTDDDRGRTYDDRNYNVLGYIRYGLTPTLTVGANWEGDRHFDLIGAEVIWASPIGSVAFNIGTDVRRPGPASSRASLQYAWRDADPHRGRSVDALFTVTGADYRTLNQIFGDNLVRLSASVRAGQMLNPRLRGQIYGGYEDVRGYGSRYYAGTNLSRQFRWGTVSLGAEYRHSREEKGPLVRASLTVPLGRGSVNASYTSQGNAARIEYNRLAALAVGAVGFSGGVEYRDGFDRQFARVTYVGNRFEAGIDQLRSNGRRGAHDLRSGFSLGSALVMADGHFALSRPVGNSFAIVGVKDGASPYRIAVDPRRGFGSTVTRYSAYSGALGSAVIPDLPAYFDRSLQVDAPDAPAGTSVGGQIFALRPGYRSGFHLTVGSDRNVSILGTLVDRSGAPVAFASGEARRSDAEEGEAPILLFTNAAGRFFLEGAVAEGRYDLTVRIGARTIHTSLSVPADVMGIHRIEQPITIDLVTPSNQGNIP